MFLSEYGHVMKRHEPLNVLRTGRNRSIIVAADIHSVGGRFESFEVRLIPLEYHLLVGSRSK